MIGIDSESSLYSFHVLYDEDMAIVKYALSERIDLHKAFDLKRIKGFTYFDLLKEVYNRKVINPLYCIAKDNTFNNELDALYNDLKTKDEYLLDKYLVSTEIYNIMPEIKSNDFKPIIFYYNDIQKNILLNDEKLKNITQINIDNIKSYNFKYIYLKYASEIDIFMKYKNKSFYISAIGTNFNKDNKFIDDDTVVEVSKNNCGISIYDIYKSNIIRSNPKEN